MGSSSLLNGTILNVRLVDVQLMTVLIQKLNYIETAEMRCRILGFHAP